MKTIWFTPNLFEIFEVFEVWAQIGSDLPFIPWDFSKFRIHNIWKVWIGSNIKCFEFLDSLDANCKCLLLLKARQSRIVFIQADDSSKKRTNEIGFLPINSTMIKLFHSFSWKKLRIAKSTFEINLPSSQFTWLLCHCEQLVKI